MWSASLTGLRPDGYTYIYMVDGAPTMDQKNTGAKVGPRGNNNRFLMPGYPDFYADKPVPHGKVEINFYPSGLLRETRNLWIYTPPGYATGNQKYPVLYLLHGSGDLEGQLHPRQPDRGRHGEADDHRDAARARHGGFTNRPREDRYPDDTYKKMFANLVANPEKTNQQMKMVMIFCGTKDHLVDASDAFDKFLTASTITHEYRRTEYESVWPGRRDDHTWPIWRMNLRDAAPLLFR